MKLTQLMQQMQEILEKHGDLPVSLGDEDVDGITVERDTDESGKPTSHKYANLEVGFGDDTEIEDDEDEEDDQ